MPMKPTNAGRALATGLLLALLGSPPPVRADDDDDEEVAHELAEKLAKAMKRAEEWQRKAAEKAEKRRHEALEELSEAQEEAREKAEDERHVTAKREAHARKDVDKFEHEALEEFEERVERYVKLHKKAAKALTVPPPGPQATPQQIVTHQRALADAIRALRMGARQGYVFVPDCQAFFKRVITAELSGRAGASARMAVLEGNPPVEIDGDDRMAVRLAINANYPEAAPVSTVPPSVLLSLPNLPEKFVEYRFVNRDLVLRDVGANMIVDFITGATPPLTAKR